MAAPVRIHHSERRAAKALERLAGDPSQELGAVARRDLAGRPGLRGDGRTTLLPGFSLILGRLAT